MFLFDLFGKFKEEDDRGQTKQVEGSEQSESILLASVLSLHGMDPSLVVPWEARAYELGAKRISASKGTALLQSVWSRKSVVQPFSQEQLAVLARFFDFAFFQPNRELIQQGEYGDFMMVQLGGVVAVERVHFDGDAVRLAQTRPGDIIGEMSLLDRGQRFSSCVTLTECEIAVLTAQGLMEMVQEQPQLAAQLLVILARKLAVRLRVVSTSIRKSTPG